MALWRQYKSRCGTIQETNSKAIMLLHVHACDCGVSWNTLVDYCCAQLRCQKTHWHSTLVSDVTNMRLIIEKCRVNLSQMKRAWPRAGLCPFAHPWLGSHITKASPCSTYEQSLTWNCVYKVSIQGHKDNDLSFINKATRIKWLPN